MCMWQVRFDDEVTSTHKAALTLLSDHFKHHPCDLCFPPHTRAQIDKLVSLTVWARPWGAVRPQQTPHPSACAITCSQSRLGSRLILKMSITCQFETT